MIEYEDDYDDEGNPIRVKITKAVLKQRLADVTGQLAAARSEQRTTWAKARAAENRLAAMAFGQRLAEAIGEHATPYAVSATLNVDHDTVEVGFGAIPMRVPSAISARLDVVLHGEPEALKRIGQALVQR